MTCCNDSSINLFRNFKAIDAEKLQLAASQLPFNDIFLMPCIDEQVIHITSLMQVLIDKFVNVRYLFMLLNQNGIRMSY